MRLGDLSALPPPTPGDGTDPATSRSIRRLVSSYLQSLPGDSPAPDRTRQDGPTGLIGTSPPPDATTLLPPCLIGSTALLFPCPHRTTVLRLTIPITATAHFWPSLPGSTAHYRPVLRVATTHATSGQPTATGLAHTSPRRRAKPRPPLVRSTRHCGATPGDASGLADSCQSASTDPDATDLASPHRRACPCLDTAARGDKPSLYRPPPGDHTHLPSARRQR